MKLWVCTHPRCLAEFCGFCKFTSHIWARWTVIWRHPSQPGVKLSSLNRLYGPWVQIISFRMTKTRRSAHEVAVGSHTWFNFSPLLVVKYLNAFTCSHLCSSSSCSLKAAKRTESVNAKGRFLSTILGRSVSGEWGCPFFSMRTIWMFHPLGALFHLAVFLALERTDVALREEDGKPPYWVRHCYLCPTFCSIPVLNI